MYPASSKSKKAQAYQEIAKAHFGQRGLVLNRQGTYDFSVGTVVGGAALDITGSVTPYLFVRLDGSSQTVLCTSIMFYQDFYGVANPGTQVKNCPAWIRQLQDFCSVLGYGCVHQEICPPNQGWVHDIGNRYPEVWFTAPARWVCNFITHRWGYLPFWPC